MPYANPSPSTSPSSTITLASPERANVPRPLRHHMRSHSSDAIPTSGSGSHKLASFIFVQPASPDTEKSANAVGNGWASTSNAVAGPSSPVPVRPRRIKLFGFTPATAANEDGPSSQDESSSNEAQRGEEDEHTPRNENGRSNFSTKFTFGSTAVPLVPVPSRAVSSSVLPSARKHERASSHYTARTSAMVRKKSGELVRSSLKTGDQLRRDKPRSAPSTPVCPKYVHFDTQLEHVKHFIAQQRPAAVSRSGSPVETETEDEPEAFPFPAMANAQAGTVALRLPNFPARLDHEQDAYVESLEMAGDGKSIRGVVRVRNLAFQKWVAVRFTLDNWQTVSEVSAEHLETMGTMSDRFVFTIKLQDLLSKLEEKTMFIAVRYTVGGREIWDNNGGQNYRVEFSRKAAASKESDSAAINQAKGKRQTWSHANGGQAKVDPMADLRRELDRLVQDDLEPTTHANTRSFTEGSPSTLSNRYDFGNSLKMFGTRAIHYDSFGPTHAPPSPPKQTTAYSTSSMIGGMPATTYVESTLSSTQSSAQQIPRAFAPLGSPVLSRANLPPDFGMPSQKHHNSSPVYSQATPLYPAPASSHRPPSPPSEAELARLYSGYQERPFLPLQEPKSNSSVRPTYSKPYPGSTGSLMQFAPLLPPSFRDRSRRSPLASPCDSPRDSPSGSPQTTSPPRRSSPPLYPDVSPPEEGLWSPASSSTDPPSSNTSETQSVDSEATSVAGSPTQTTHGPSRPSGAMEFSSFLDKYCFLNNGGANGSSPESALFGEIATPRRSIAGGCGPGYYSPSVSSRNSSGASTPPREVAFATGSAAVVSQ